MARATPSSTHPPLPPTQEDDRRACLRLLRSRRIGIATYRRLLAEHGSAPAALAALPQIARAAGDTDYRPCPEGVVRAEMRAGARAGARLIFEGAADWPAALVDLEDAPPMLWAIGDTALLARPAVALVGARNASSLGTRMARKLAGELAEAGFVVVSGLARGIDACAHTAALQGGTIAVFAGGADVIYPPQNHDLGRAVMAQGLVLSERPIGVEPQARHFPTRNRIVSGLSRAVIVVEAAARSGSLITARCALEQGREVMMVPGHPLDPRASGCNMLLRDGAILVRSAEDVIEEIGPALAPERPASRPASRTAAAPDPGDLSFPEALPGRSLAASAALHSQILDRLGPSPLAEDQLLRDLGRPVGELAPALTDLELDGRITRSAGGLLTRLT